MTLQEKRYSFRSLSRTFEPAPRRFTTILLLLFLQTLVFGQSKVAIGQECPPLTITDWVYNQPDDKNLDNQMIIVDFWATWCGPCLKAVPHYNQLVEEFADNDQLIFLSMTYESPAKIQRTLDRIAFKSVVVTDRESQTQEAFGIGEIPYTLVIMPDKQLAWEGHPEALTPEIIRDLLAGKKVERASPAEVSSFVDLGAANLGLQDFAAALKDSTVEQLFKLIPSPKQGGLRVAKLPQFYYEAGAGLQSFLASVLELPKSRVEIPESLQDDFFNIVYIDRGNTDKNGTLDLMLSRIQEEYSVKIVQEKKRVNAYAVTVVDTSLLTPATSEQGSISDAGEKLIITGQSLPDVLARLEADLETPLVDQTGLNTKYDFIIEVDSKKRVIESLKSYGLKLEKVRTELPFCRVIFE